jgi:hypothetical protein
VGKLDKSVKKITADSTFDVADGKLRGECCTLCSSREAIRAVLSNDLPLLQAVTPRMHAHSHTHTHTQPTHAWILKCEAWFAGGNGLGVRAFLVCATEC